MRNAAYKEITQGLHTRQHARQKAIHHAIHTLHDTLTYMSTLSCRSFLNCLRLFFPWFFPARHACRARNMARNGPPSRQRQRLVPYELSIAGIKRHHEWSAQPRARTHWVKSMVKSRHIADCHADCSASGHVPLERDTMLKKQVKKTKKY